MNTYFQRFNTTISDIELSLDITQQEGIGSLLDNMKNTITSVGIPLVILRSIPIPLIKIGVVLFTIVRGLFSLFATSSAKDKLQNHFINELIPSIKAHLRASYPIYSTNIYKTSQIA